MKNRQPRKKLGDRIKKAIKDHFIEIIHLQISPHSIASGFALGTFISVLPTPGFNIILGIIVTLIFSRINKFSLFGAILLWNPFTAAFIYPTSYAIGNNIFGTLPAVDYQLTFFDYLLRFSRRFIVGNLILASSTALASYGITRLAAEIIQHKEKKKQAKR